MTDFVKITDPAKIYAAFESDLPQTDWKNLSEPLRQSREFETKKSIEVLVKANRKNYDI